METELNVGTVDDLKQRLGLEVEPKAEVKAPEPEVETPEPEVESQEPVGEPTETETPQVSSEDATEGAEVKEPEPQTTEPQETIFDIVNKTYSTEFKDEDELKLAFDSLKRNKELEEQLSEFESLKEKNIALQENLDPMKYFDSEDDFKAALFKKQFPDRNGHAVAELFSQDLATLSDKDAVVMSKLIETPGLTKQDVESWIDEQYNIEEGEEMSRADLVKMKIEGADAKKNLKSIKGQVNMPDKVDADSLVSHQKELMAQKQEKLTDEWSSIAKKVVTTVPDVVIKDKDADGNEVELFRYSPDQTDLTNSVDSMVNYMVNSGIDVDENAVQSMATALQKDSVSRNLEQIVKLAIDDAKAKAEEERLTKQHNPGEAKPAAAATSTGKRNASDDILSHLNTKGFQRTTFLDKA